MEADVSAQERFGHRLKMLREQRGMNQDELAKKLKKLIGMSPKYISQLECGNRRPSWNTLLDLAKALGIGLSELTDGIDVPAPGTPELTARFERLTSNEKTVLMRIVELLPSVQR
jgi:transcriptional regulator with XRE-family HTH domain